MWFNSLLKLPKLESQSKHLRLSSSFFRALVLLGFFGGDFALILGFFLPFNSWQWISSTKSIFRQEEEQELKLSECFVIAKQSISSWVSLGSNFSMFAKASTHIFTLADPGPSSSSRKCFLKSFTRGSIELSITYYYVLIKEELFPYLPED